MYPDKSGIFLPLYMKIRHTTIDFLIRILPFLENCVFCWYTAQIHPSTATVPLQFSQCPKARTRVPIYSVAVPGPDRLGGDLAARIYPNSSTTAGTLAALAPP